MRERDVERHLVKLIEDRGGLCWKWSGRTGVPDRIVMLPGNVVVFVEVKTEGGRVSALQRHTHKAMQRLGLDVRLVWSKLDVEVLVNEICGA